MWRAPTAALSLMLLGTVSRAAEPADDVAARGRYLATAADCAACHTTPNGGKPYAGGYPIASPLGAIYATNITPSKSHGIGNYSEVDFKRALRKGVRRDGAHLYPAMPYTAYAQLSDADVHALYVYFMREVAPVDSSAPPTHLPFPFNMRFSMAFWNALFLTGERAKADPTKSAEWNRGAYLTNALAHCSSCHSPRGLLMQERSSAALSGGALGEWFAPNITSDPVSGIGTWSQAEIATYLKTGRVKGKAQAAGGMAEAITHSLSHLPDDDLAAIALYLKTVPAVRDESSSKSATSYGMPASIEASLRGAPPTGALDGKSLYSGLCASCHGGTGGGTGDQSYPSLYHNSTVGAARPDNLIAVILRGVDRTAGGQHVLMPAFGDASFVQPLSDAQIAAVATFVRQTFGPGDRVTEDQVAVARSGGPSSNILLLARTGMALAALLIGTVLIWLVRRRRIPKRREIAR